MKAADALIAWNGADHPAFRRDAPPGSIGIGPLQTETEPDWAGPYARTGGAAYVGRRQLRGLPQQHQVMLDWYRLVYGYGIHPYLAHRAFLLIDEYQEVIKDMGCGPAKDEPGHDPGVGYGRTVLYPVPEIKITHTGRGTHFHPVTVANVAGSLSEFGCMAS
jgi:hypothetical protein